MEYSILIYLWFFMVYAFLGWAIEVSFQTLTKGVFINRGFLNGPLCPIYGFGMIILLYLLGPISDNLFLLFGASIILTSTLEYITGFILEKLFDEKWWDYSDMPFNIKGYISLSFSILWGLGAVFVIEIIHPFIFRFVSILQNKVGNLLLFVFFLYLIADFLVTLNGILEMNRHFKLLESMADRLKDYSDEIGENIYNRVSKVVEAGEKLGEDYKNLESRYEELTDREKNILNLKKKREKLLEDKHFVHKRLERAYPNLKKKLSKIQDQRKNNIKD